MSNLKYILIFFVVVTLWFQRHIFFDKYDAEYMHNLYSFSQWALPLSSRTMGDADLFAYSGYNLTNEFKPFSVNPETPIFAKLFFGYSAKFFGNQHLASPLFLILLLLAMDILAKKYFKFDTTKRLFLAIFIFCSAETQEQVKLTLLDLPQVALFAWHLVFLFKSTQNNSHKFKDLTIAGLLLGFMTATKFGLYTPLIIMTNAWYLYKNKQLRLLPIVLLATIIGYLLPYSPVLISDGISSFIQAQKWVLNFYLSSGVIAPAGMLLITSFTGMYKGWVGSNWQNIYTWNGEWGLGLLALAYSIRDWIKSKKIINIELEVILILLSTVLLILLKIPFWPRYMIFFIPFFWLLILNHIKDQKMLVLLLIFPIISTFKLGLQTYLPPTTYLTSINLAAYEELYNYLATDFHRDISRSEFVQENLAEYENIQPYMIETKIEEEIQTAKGTEHIVTIFLKGYFGEKLIRKKIIWRQEHSEWKITNIESILQEKKLFEEEMQIICVNAVKVKDWGYVYGSLSKLYGTTAENIQKKVMQLAPRDYCMPIGKIMPKNNTTKNEDQNFPEGIQILSNSISLQ